MNFGMNLTRTIMCPHFKGSDHGAECSAAMQLIRDIESADIKFCMSRHYEICNVYVNSLKSRYALKAGLHSAM